MMHGGHAIPHREEYVAINQLNPHTHDKVNVKMIVIDVNAAFRMSNGDLLQTIKVGDPTACINLTIRHPEAIEMFIPGDILRLKQGFVNIHRGSLHLQANRTSDIVRIGEFCLAYAETPNMSEYKSEYAALERQKKGSPPEEGEVSGGDPRRARGGSVAGKRSGFPSPGAPPAKRGTDPRSRP